MTDTPETDAAARDEHGLPGSRVVQVDASRRIERGRSVAEASITQLQQKLKLAREALLQAAELTDERKLALEKQMIYSVQLHQLLMFACGEDFDITGIPDITGKQTVIAWKKKEQTAKQLHNAALAKEHEEWAAERRQAGEHNKALEFQLKAATELAATCQMRDAEATTHAADVEAFCVELASLVKHLGGYLPEQLQPVAKNELEAWQAFQLKALDVVEPSK